MDVQALDLPKGKWLLKAEGKNGARFYDGEEIKHVSCISVDVQDTTGAGDTFNGALAGF